MTACPIIETERLRLRPYHIGDFDAYADFYASDRAAHTGNMTRKTAWYCFGTEAGTWALRGYGYWSVERDAKLAGHIGILHNDDDPEAELGWVLYDGFEGQGLAFEGAMAARDWLYAETALDAVVSYIDPNNARSIALAERMGAAQDGTVSPHDADDLVYRHPPKAVLQ